MDAAREDLPQAIDHRQLQRRATTQGVARSEEEKALALSIYAETGSVDTAAQETGLPATTVRNWIDRDPEIDSKLEALRRVLRERMAHKYATIAIESAEALLDRVRNGDYRVDKNGETTRVPVLARELAFITSVAGDKHALLTGTMQKQRGEDQALTSLADKLVSALERNRLARRTVDATYPQDDAKKAGDNSSITDSGPSN